MAYNPRNKLLQMQDVIDVYLEHKKEGVSTRHVYRTYIKPRFHISLATLYNYLATPVKKLLLELDEQEKQQNESQGV